CQQYDEFPFTF
nr:immunoglobulin light chain junction region [Macaca mulatta]MOW09546.1 immunoglobulin light chain junction region [Macaca mulatta]MOW09721.1 immunoglobulin light chain junction region [Macaca mulatta]MOW10723.1 immunoglobulin light chain junction region [Macaca mulatta]MOW13820.1 immunoglobulin light chain junction region [Macaca mulatta]